MNNIYTLLIAFLISFSAVAQNDDPEIEVTEDEAAMMAEMMASMFGGGDIVVEDTYSFDFEYVISSFESEGDFNEEITILLNEDETTTAMSISYEEDGQKGEMTMIYNWTTKASITLSDADGQKFGFAMSLDGFDDLDFLGEEMEEIEIPEMTKTGKTETIAGYVCDEYTTEDDYETTYIYISQKKDIISRSGFFAFADMNGLGDYSELLPGDGSVLKWVTKNNNSDYSEGFEVTKISPSTNTTVSTVGYEFDMMNMMED